MRATISSVAGRKRAAKDVSEAEFQKQVVDIARAHGWRVTHFRPARTGRLDQNDKPVWSTPLSGDPGFFDLVLARFFDVPRLLLVELKTEKGKESPAQVAWRLALGPENLRDWEGYLWGPSDIEA